MNVRESVTQSVQLLPAPDVPDAIDGVFDPTGVTGGVAVVAPAEADLEPGDEVTMHVDGPNSSNMIARGVPGSGAGQSLTILFPVEAFASNLDNYVDVYYSVHRFIDGRDDSSDVRKIYVGAKSLSLPAPRIREAVGDELDPLEAKTRLTATVNYEGGQPSDEVRVNWIGNGTGGSYQTEWIVVGGVPRDIPLNPAVVPFNLGQSVAVTYEVRRAGALVGVSDPLTLEVLALDTSPEGPLPVPQLKGIEGDELDLELVANGGVVTVTPPWPLIAEGQRFWLDMEGTDADGNPHNYRQANAVLVNAQHVEVGLANRQVPANYFASLANGSTLTLVFKVAFDGSANEAEAVTFPLRTYTVGKASETFTEDFESAVVGYIPLNSTVRLAFFDVTNTAGEVAISRTAIQPQPVSDQMLYVRTYAQARIEFHFPVHRVRIGFNTGVNRCLVHFLDADRKRIHTTDTQPGGGYSWMEFERETAEIMSVEFADRGTGTYVDNVTVET